MISPAEEALMASGYDFYQVSGQRAFPLCDFRNGSISGKILAYLIKHVDGQKQESLEGSLGRGDALTKHNGYTTAAIEFDYNDTFEQAQQKIEEAHARLEAA